MHRLFIEATLKKSRNIYNCFFDWYHHCLLIFRVLRKLAERIEKLTANYELSINVVARSFI